MKALADKLFLTGFVLGISASLATGQTGRIAQLSHGGSTAVRVAEQMDNFGIHPQPTAQWKADTLTYQNDSVAIHSGSYISFIANGEPKVGWHHKVEAIRYAGNKRLLNASAGTDPSFESLREWYSNTVFIGFDKLKKPARKKSSGQIQVFPKRPFQYSYWRGLAGAVALGGVGWLLGRKPRPKSR